jgi:hypothetical protein
MILGIFKKMLPWLYHDPVGFLIEFTIEQTLSKPATGKSLDHSGVPQIAYVFSYQNITIFLNIF